MTDGMTAEIKERFDALDAAVAQVATAITGNPAMGHVGIVDRLKSIEGLKDEFTKWKWFAAGLAAGCGFAGGLGASWLLDQIPK